VSLQLSNFSIELPGRTLLRPVSLEVAVGEIVTIMGPSGIGKTSLLSAIAGDLPTPITASGRILLCGHDITELRPEQRKIGRLFQDDMLFPHLTVGENLLFGMPRGQRQQRLHKATEALASVDLAGFEDRPPHTLSGGQAQRVALMRMLLAEPSCVLLDEPFSKFDKALRMAMRELVFGQLMARSVPTLLVTHDQSDAPKGARILEFASSGELHDV
jgi:putative thiamine transport system ATP-binding protein